MPKFSYIASTVKGESIRGFLQASTKAEVAKLLSGQGLFLISCKMEDALREAALIDSPSRSHTAAALAPNAAAQPSLWETFTRKRSEAGVKVKPRGKVPLNE